jgi:aryl-alcohol dehydrogenase-like predicted oxidoreductase
MKFLDQAINPLGMGCWPIGGPMFSGDQPLGYSNSDDAESIRTIHAALAGGISLFDTAAAYGAGHAERLLASALKDRPEALIVTKIGIAIDEATKQLTGDEIEPETVLPAIDRCLSRLGRDRIDLLLLHQNGLSVSQAEAMFDEMDRAVEAGKVRAYGWSTDFAASVSAVASRDAFVAVEHALNVLVSPPRIQAAARDNGLAALIRSPLAMGLLTGKYSDDAVIPSGDIRGTANPKTDYFVNARSNPTMLAQLDELKDLLMTGGRTLTQGAICWLWSKGDMNIPVPGARTVGQIEGLAAALSFDPLSVDVMDQIEALIDREPEDTPDRAR